MLLFFNYKVMLNVREARDIKVKVSWSLDLVLNQWVIDAIEKWKKEVSIILSTQDCKESNIQIKSYLEQNWYKDVNVSDNWLPWYCDWWKTDFQVFIKFSI